MTLISRSTFIVVLSFCCLIHAQNGEYQLNLFKDNLSWIWLGRLNLDLNVNSKTAFYFKNQFTSNLKTAEGNKWRDDNILEGNLSLRIGEPLQTSTRLKSQIFSDENAFVKFSKHLIYQEMKYIPVSKVSLSPAFGWTSEDIYSFRDHGWYSQMIINIDAYDIGGYSNTSKGFSALYAFPDRRNQEHRYFIAFRKQFSPLASDSIQVGYEFVDNTYPLSPGSTANIKQLEDVQINSRFLYNNLTYKLSSRSFLNVETELRNRDINRNNPNLLNHREEINFANRVGIRHNGNRVSSGFIFFTSQETNLSSVIGFKKDKTRTDIETLQSAFNFFVHWRNKGSDEVRYSFSYTKYELSSPDTSQLVDFDDLRFMFDLTYIHRFSKYFLLKLNGNLELEHQIFIHPSRSANNHWWRNFLLASSFTHTIPNVLQHRFQIEILADYRVYDFEEFLPEIRSFLFRMLVYSDSLQIHFTPRLRLQTIYQLELGDNGTFFKDIFAQQVSRELTSHLIDIGLIYTGIKGVQLTTALNWYLRKEWSLVSGRQLVRDNVAFSPRISIKYGVGKRLFFLGSFSPRSEKRLNIPTNYFTLGRIDLRYYL